ncbi:MAG: hypothetical protein K2F63_01370 [Muribaculaceae bacterium]|nr:hypothetical protein [Muribaculaceae bacterium]
MSAPSPEENKKKIDQAAKDLPGEAINIADGQKNTEALQKERTCTLGNNPRNNDIDQ